MHDLMNKYIGLFFCLAIVISCEHSSQLSSFDYNWKMFSSQ